MNDTPPEMLISADDLDRAVAEGILSADQSARLQAFAARAHGEVSTYTSADEPFRFVRGFRDVFISLGLILLFGGVVGTIAAYFAGFSFFYVPVPHGVGPVVAHDGLAVAFAALAIGAWLTGELITARLRLPLASIVVVSAFAAAVAATGLYGLIALAPGTGESSAGIIAGSASIMATAIYYWRFRLPYALLPIAAAGVLIFVSFADMISPGGLQANTSHVFGLAGLAVFAAAMTYDMRDPQRITRFAECAFWLHLLAAPLIVHSLINTVGDVDQLSTGAAILIVAVIAVIGLVALLIDRRALLVSTLLYLGLVVGFTLEQSGLGGQEQFFLTLVVLGVFALTLGLGWTPLRRILFRFLPDGGLVRRLPHPS